MISPEERFATLFEHTHIPLLAYAARRVHDPADAADVVAETFVVAWRRLDRVPAGAEARPWLFGVARLVLANHHRGERRRNALADRLRDSLRDTVPPPSAGESLVEVALGTLRENDREILRLVAWEELEHQEIAVVLGISQVAVRVRLHRARQRLARAMETPREKHLTAVKQDPRTGHVPGEWATAHSGTEESS